MLRAAGMTLATRTSEMPRPNGRPPIGPRDIAAAERPALRRLGSWKRFHHGPRKQAQALLQRLPRYANCVLVAGCQRSGTTMLTRVIAGARGFRRFALTPDDELDAALILCGEVTLPADARYCFQTTYLNERFGEYRLLQPGQRLIWVLRNPYSVVYSMLYNWRRFALVELYEACAPGARSTDHGWRRRLPWPLGPSLAEKACAAYAGKTAQIRAIRELLAPGQLLVIDYDRLVRAPGEWLPRIFDFIGEPYDPAYARGIRADSLGKAQRMSRRLAALVERVATPVYRDCVPLADHGRPAR